MDKNVVNTEQDANFYYTYGDMGMKNDGSFTKEKRYWMTFTRETAARMVAQNVKPYGATRRGVFTGTVSGERFREPAKPVTPQVLPGAQFNSFEEPAAAPVKRFEIGATLTKEQRKSVLSTLVDVYKLKGAEKETRINARGDEYFAYPHQPDLFEKSDITGAMVRYYVTLPDGRIAHPTELFPDYTLADIEAEIRLQRGREESDRRFARELDWKAQDANFTSPEADSAYWQKLSDESKGRTAHGGWSIAPPSERLMLTKDGLFYSVYKDAGDTIRLLRSRGWMPVKMADELKEPAQGVKEAQSSITSASWVIREKATGNIVMETFDRAKVDALNTVRYEAVPIAEYLASLNKAHQEHEQETKLNLDITKEDSELIDQIVERAAAHFPSINRMNLTMDMMATHGNGCPLDLKGLLEAGTADFNHDIAGIVNHINRQTFKLEDCFCPRYAASNAVDTDTNSAGAERIGMRC